jgi:hypothetical protein
VKGLKEVIEGTKRSIEKLWLDKIILIRTV